MRETQKKKGGEMRERRVGLRTGRHMSGAGVGGVNPLIIEDRSVVGKKGKERRKVQKKQRGCRSRREGMKGSDRQRMQGKYLI